MSERLEQLETLWAASLEGTIDKAGEKTLKELMQDAELMESFSLDQESRATAELVPDLDWKKVDKAVIDRYHRQSISWGSALFVLVAAVAAGVVGTQWLMQRDWHPQTKTKVPAWSAQGHEEDRSTSSKGYEEENAPLRRMVAPANAKRLGAAPPASDLKVSQGPKGIQVDFHQAQSGRANLKVLDAQGTLVLKLHQGDLGAGKWRFVWEGLNHAGNHPGPGKYTIKGQGPGLDQSYDIEIYSAP